MSKSKTKKELIAHKKQALSVLEKHLDSLINSTDSNIQSKADLLCFWIKDYSRFLENESSFDPKKNKKYKRGDIIKAHLGYRIGSEQGGLHYCIVLDNNNSLLSNVITVLPLRSLKPKDNINNLNKLELWLNDELFNNLYSKAKDRLDDTKSSINSINQKVELLKKSNSNCDSEFENHMKQLLSLQESLSETNKIVSEIKNMKQGSIALISQITTISKLRIYDPKTTRDVLSEIRISNETLDNIDKVILENYTKK